MHPIAKPILIALGAVLLLWAALVLLANIYLQSESVQGRLRDSITRAAGMPAKIRQTYYTPWSGITLSGVTLLPADTPGSPLLEAKSLRASMSLFRLLGGQVVIDHITLESPVLELRQAAAPPAEALPEPIPADSMEAAEVPLPGSTLVQTEIPPKPSAKSAPPVRIEAFAVNNGRAALLDSNGAKILELDGIFLDAKPAGDNRFAGTYRIERGVVWNSLRPRSFSGRFEWDNGRLSLPDLQSTLANGQLKGQLEWLPAGNFAFTAQAEGLELKTLANDAGLEAEGTRGQLSAKIALAGLAGQPASYQGNAEASLAEARMEPIEIIRQLGEILRVEELKMFELQTAEAAFTIRDEKVLVDRLQLASENFMIDATGTTAFTGDLDLDARLHVNEKLRRDTRGLIGKNFKPSETEGYSHMPFSITGTLARPKSDLLDKIVGLRLGQDVGGLLKNLLRMPQKPKSKPSPAPSPAASPAP
ncbi:MAG: AsmA family protein [Verrucomicrobiota bacterium]